MLVACSTRVEQTEDDTTLSGGPRPGDEDYMYITAGDSTIVQNLAVDYLTKARDGRIEECLNMLYDYDPKADVVSPIGEQSRQRIDNLLRTFPVVDFTIDHVIFDGEIDTRVDYTIKLFEAEAGSDIPNTMSQALTPKRLNGTWYLCVDPLVE